MLNYNVQGYLYACTAPSTFYLHINWSINFANKLCVFLVFLPAVRNKSTLLTAFQLESWAYHVTVASLNPRICREISRLHPIATPSN